MFHYFQEISHCVMDLANGIFVKLMDEPKESYKDFQIKLSGINKIDLIDPSSTINYIQFE